MTDNAVRNVIIIGSGPAGYTAALYAARADLEPLVFEGSQYGGALMTTTEVENFPGFPEAVMGPELMENMRAQAEKFGADIRSEDVTEVELTGDIKIVRTHDEEFRAEAVIVATGSKYRYLGLVNEERLLGHGVSACATCDGFFFRDQDIAVVGGGDTALEEATFLTRYAKSVTVVHRRDELRASKIMQDRAFANPKIKFIWDTIVTDVLGDETVSAVRVQNVRTGEESDLDVTGMFVAIGHEPRSDLVRGQLHADDAGYLLVDTPSTRTNLPGVFAAGDVRGGSVKRVASAVGEGSIAAHFVSEHLGSRTVASSRDSSRSN